MSLQARTSSTITATSFGFDAGLVGTLGVAVYDVDGVAVTPRTTAGIYAIAGFGVYAVDLLTPADPGTYLVVWDDGTNSATEELLVADAPTVPVGQSTPADWTPSLADVSLKLRARTTDENSNELGLFGPTTRPTGAEVVDITVEEVGALAAYVGTDLPATVWPLAKSAALARVAARIELDYWPEQVRSDRSPYTELADERDREETRLLGALRALGVGEGGGQAFGSLSVRTPAAVASEALLTEGYYPWQTGHLWPDDSRGWGAAGGLV